MKIKVQEIARHRNGICGEPFYAVRFSSEDTGNALGIVFGDPADDCPKVAVISLDKLPECGVAFAGGNSWRGDHFSDDLWAAIKADNAKQDRAYAKELAKREKPATYPVTKADGSVARVTVPES